MNIYPEYYLLNLNNKEYKLRLSINNILLLEKELGKNVYNTLIDMSQYKCKIKEVKLFLKYSLIDNSISYNDLYEDLIENGYTQIDISEIMLELFQLDYDSENDIDNDNNDNELSNDNNIDNNYMSDIISNLLENALYYGISEKDFKEMTYGEAVRVIKVRNKKELDDYKEKLSADYSLANLIGISVGRLMSKDIEFLSLYEYYPQLFKDELEEERRLKEENFEKDFFKILEVADQNYKIQRKLKEKDKQIKERNKDK